MEYQQIAAVVLSCPSLVRAPPGGGSGTVGVVMWWFSCLAHCWVLRQQGREMAPSFVGGVFRVCLFLVFLAMTVHALLGVWGVWFGVVV